MEGYFPPPQFSQDYSDSTNDRLYSSSISPPTRTQPALSYNRLSESHVPPRSASATSTTQSSAPTQSRRSFQSDASRYRVPTPKIKPTFQTSEGEWRLLKGITTTTKYYSDVETVDIGVHFSTRCSYLPPIESVRNEYNPLLLTKDESIRFQNGLFIFNSKKFIFMDYFIFPWDEEENPKEIEPKAIPIIEKTPIIEKKPIIETSFVNSPPKTFLSTSSTLSPATLAQQTREQVSQKAATTRTQQVNVSPPSHSHPLHSAPKLEKSKTMELKFKRFPTCHGFFQMPQIITHGVKKPHILETRTGNEPNIDNVHILIGFSSGDLLVYDAWDTDHVKLHVNRSGAFNNSIVTSFKYLPQLDDRPGLCIASFSDGSVAIITPDLSALDSIQAANPQGTSMLQNPAFDIRKDFFAIWRNPKPDTHPSVKWQFCQQPINEIQISPNGKWLAAACGDGYLRVVSLISEYHSNLTPVIPSKESLLTASVHNPAAQVPQSIIVDTGKCVAFQSYFGGFTCVAWSPDGKYLLSGGEDDLVSLWSVSSRQLLVRCQAHRSWISCVAFDTWNYPSSPSSEVDAKQEKQEAPEQAPQALRFGSVGHDGRLILWEYSPEQIYPTSPVPSRRSNPRHSNDSDVPHFSLPDNQRNRRSQNDCLEVPTKSRFQVPMLDPMVDQRVHHVSSHSIIFTKTALIVSGNNNPEDAVRVFARPGHHLKPEPETLEVSVIEELDERKAKPDASDPPDVIDEAGLNLPQTERNSEPKIGIVKKFFKKERQIPRGLTEQESEEIINSFVNVSSDSSDEEKFEKKEEKVEENNEKDEKNEEEKEEKNGEEKGEKEGKNDEEKGEKEEKNDEEKEESDQKEEKSDEKDERNCGEEKKDGGEKDEEESP